MTKRITRAGIAALPVLALLAPWSAAHAAGAPDFTATATTYDVDTTALTITGSDATFTGTDDNGKALFSFGNVDIPVGATLTVHGSRRLELSASGTFSLAGTIDGSGQDAAEFGAVVATGGPGGGDGGLVDPNTPGSGAGGGQGGGQVATDTHSGSGGGGFGGAGAAGADTTGTGTGGAGGATYGTARDAGSGGAGDPQGATSGGGGGGGIEVDAASISVTTDGVIHADGGDGSTGDNGAAGGGSGGGIVLHAPTIDMSGTLTANGGGGGGGGCCGDAGGGGGGRILYDYATSVAHTGTASVTGGASGSVSPCCGSGTPSADPKGADGTVVENNYTPAGPDSTSTSIATGFASVTYGQKVAVRTVLTDTTTNTAVGGATVSLYRRTSPDGAWSLVGSRTTTSSGRAGIALTPHATSDYQWRYAGDVVILARKAVRSVSHSGSTSDNATIRVVQFVYSHVTDGTVTHSSTAAYHVYGWVQPASTGQRVYLQRKSGTSWVAVTNQVLKNQKLPSGTTRVSYNFRVSAPKAGTFTYRVYKPATATLDKAYSASVTFTVK